MNSALPPAQARPVEDYVEAAQRENTLRSYASALRHYEETWGGLLPASAAQVAKYLATYAGALSHNTLKQRLAAVAQWHKEHGFADPTRASLVKQTLKGIQALHPAQEKRATPLQLTELGLICRWLDEAIQAADERADAADALRLRRDKAMLLLGFWRGFRTDELVRLQVEHLTLVPDQGMTCFLPRSKGDRQLAGTTYRVPALSRWCAVEATCDWVDSAKLTGGPLFRAVDRWGHLAQTGLHANSVIPLFRQFLTKAGVADAQGYSGHSLRRGFASWASANGWDVRALMEYVGWKSVQSAMRYVDGPDAFGQARIEAGIATPAPPPPALPSPSPKPTSAEPVCAQVAVILAMRLTTAVKKRGTAKARQMIEFVCLKRHGAVPLDAARSRYRLHVQAPDDLGVDEAMSQLIEDIHRIADNHGLLVEAHAEEEAGTRRWD